MAQLPSQAMLEAGHAFPGRYMFKIIGRTDDGFVGRTVAAVREALAADVDPTFSVRQTQGGRHVCVTLDVEVGSSEEVLAVYRRATLLSGLVLLL